MSLLSLANASIAFGHLPLLDEIDLNIEHGERVCLIGRNGAGKSTLMNVVAGDQVLDSGVRRTPDSVRIARLAQEVPDAGNQTIFEVVADGLGPLSDLLREYHSLSAEISGGAEQALNRLSAVQAELDRLDAWDASSRIDAVLSRLGLPADARMASSSGGIRRRAMLAQALVSEPDLLLLDEPTNHLDIESIDALTASLLGFEGAVLFITHDRAFADELSTRIVELDRGRLNSYPGSFSAYQQRKAAELEAEATQARKFDKELAQEEAWIREGIKARRTRNEGRVRRLQAMRAARSARQERSGGMRMKLDSSAESGNLVLEVEGASVSFAGHTLIRDFSTTIMRGDRVGIIGPNGSGKSTLLKLMLGELVPDEGSVRHGARLEIAYFDQERLQLDPDSSVVDNLALGSDHVEIAGKRRHVIGYLQDFLFAPARAKSPVKTLSGGERNRLLLARLFARPANVLVLDEPTNDLDLESLELLEELLLDFDGTLLLVSHDRAFLDKTISSTLVLEGGGRVGEYVGGYSDWRRQAVASEAASKPPSDSGSAASGADKARSTQTRPPRLSYKDQRELDALPEQIETLEARQQALSDETSAASFYDQPKAAIEDVLQSLTQVTQALDTAYQRWEELEARREADH